MPSGSYVKVIPYTRSYRRRGTYLLIYVYPLRVDAYQTIGLCGNYNLDPTDDGPASGRDCTAPCERHR